MNLDSAIRGNLFAPDFLNDPESVGELPTWSDLGDAAMDEVEDELRGLFDQFPCNAQPNESQTEDDLIWKVLRCLGWTAHLRQQNLSHAGRADVPDGLLFVDDDSKRRANEMKEDHAKYAIGAAIVESKRWMLPLDTASEQTSAPSTQMRRYLRRADDRTEGRMRWGILTNGAQWRLYYYQGGHSVSEDFLEVDLAVVLEVLGHNQDASSMSADDLRHCLRLFVLLFGRRAFLPESVDGRSLHYYALSQSRLYEERVAANISDLVFKKVFREMLRAIASAAPQAPLGDVRDAALILLYRLLFLLFAEDRALLPVTRPSLRQHRAAPPSTPRGRTAQRPRRNVFVHCDQLLHGPR